MRRPDPWGVCAPEEAVEVRLGCSFELRAGELSPIVGRPSTLIGIPYDRPVVGYGGKTINTLRLWMAGTPDYFDFQQFSRGDFVGALAETLSAESLTRVLYPTTPRAGRGLRFLQEYFLVACSLGDLVRRFRRGHADGPRFPDKAAIQLNDTHPALAVPELMRILLDEAGLGWDAAWDITKRTLGYTNHTLLPEALEKWPLAWFEVMLPRHLEIVFEINRRLLDDVRARFPATRDASRGSAWWRRARSRTSAWPTWPSWARTARTAWPRSTPPCCARRRCATWPRCSPSASATRPTASLRAAGCGWPTRTVSRVTAAIGEGWITDLAELRRLAPLADDPAFREEFRGAAREAKARFAAGSRAVRAEVDPDSIFDCHIKRIHEYKRQVLNALRIIVLYDRLREDPNRAMAPRTFFFAGKAAPAYHTAKLNIKFINNLAATIDADPAVRGRIKVVFLPDYSVSLAERLIPASDVSNQISTAGYEASGTSNMKFMMNGALTIGTRDGATIEMAEAAGRRTSSSSA
jgi:starch phosphorylase